jgi:hypothetical protein
MNEKMFSHLTTCDDVNSIKDGDLLVIQRKSDKRNIIVQCKKILNRRSGNEEVLISRGKNDYFIWSMYKNGESWVWRVWNLGGVELTNITNTMNNFPRN